MDSHFQRTISIPCLHEQQCNNDAYEVQDDDDGKHRSKTQFFQADSNEQWSSEKSKKVHGQQTTQSFRPRRLVAQIRNIAVHCHRHNGALSRKTSDQRSKEHHDQEGYLSLIVTFVFV